MKVLLDTNVFIDVFQERQPHYLASAGALASATTGDVNGVIAAHVVPDIYYIVRKFSGRDAAGQLVDWMLGSFETVPTSTCIMTSARELPILDFEDAVVAASAQAAACDFIITRDLHDFRKSPVPALLPADLLSRLAR